jgi:hypothetical protein
MYKDDVDVIKVLQSLLQVWFGGSPSSQVALKKAGMLGMRLAASRCLGHARPEEVTLHKYARHLGGNDFRFVHC